MRITQCHPTLNKWGGFLMRYIFSSIPRAYPTASPMGTCFIYPVLSSGFNRQALSVIYHDVSMFGPDIIAYYSQLIQEVLPIEQPGLQNWNFRCSTRASCSRMVGLAQGIRNSAWLWWVEGDSHKSGAPWIFIQTSDMVV